MKAAGAREVRDELALDTQSTRLRKQGGVHPAADHLGVRLCLALSPPLSSGVALRLSRRLRPMLHPTRRRLRLMRWTAPG